MEKEKEKEEREKIQQEKDDEIERKKKEEIVKKMQSWEESKRLCEDEISAIKSKIEILESNIESNTKSLGDKRVDVNVSITKVIFNIIICIMFKFYSLYS